MPRKRDERRREDAPRTDLPPVKEPYYEGYFGTEEEEGVVREEESGEGEGGGEGESEDERERGTAEDSAGGDREII